MTDILERLQNWETVYPEDESKPEGHLYVEAAAEIDRLRAENKRLYQIARNYCDPFNMRVEDWQYVEKLMEEEWELDKEKEDG